MSELRYYDITIWKNSEKRDRLAFGIFNDLKYFDAIIEECFEQKSLYIEMQCLEVISSDLETSTISKLFGYSLKLGINILLDDSGIIID